MNTNEYKSATIILRAAEFTCMQVTGLCDLIILRNYIISLLTTHCVFYSVVCRASFALSLCQTEEKWTCVKHQPVRSRLKAPVTITTARPIEEREAVYKGVQRCWGDRTNVLQQVLNWPRSFCCPGDLELRRAESLSPGTYLALIG